MLALLLERRSEEQFVADFTGLLGYYDAPDPVSRVLLTAFEYNNLKTVASSLMLGQTDLPYLVDIGAFSFIDRKKWPNLAAMTRNSPVSWYVRAPSVDEQVMMETRLDQQYYTELWASLRSLGRADRGSTEKLIRAEITLRNITWALRLRVYYSKTEDEIVPMLSDPLRGKQTDNSFVQPAIAALRKSTDLASDWDDWSYAWLLNPSEADVPWKVDPRWVELAADKYLFRLAMRQFHLNPFRTGMLVSFFKIKQLELQMIRVAAEGLRLGASESQMQEFTGGA
jgi:vacuolar-type H+-ATPase subunit C/Vma6